MKTKISEVENKMPDTSGLVTNSFLNTKISEVENKIPDVSGLIKKIDCSSKMSDIEKEYFNFSDYNKFTKEIHNAEIKKRNYLFYLIFLISETKKINLKNKPFNISDKNKIKSRAR